MSLSGNSEHVVIGVYVVEYVVNGSYDSGVLRTKLIGECRSILQIFRVMIIVLLLFLHSCLRIFYSANKSFKKEPYLWYVVDQSSLFKALYSTIPVLSV